MDRTQEQKSWAFMTAVLLGLSLMFFLTFFNRFAGLRSGDGEYTSGLALLSGHMPYRDYFTTAPPLNILKSALLLRTFGTALIVNRAAGILERLIIAIILFRWLAQLFRPWHALVASFVTIVVSTGDLTDPIASYNHDAILFAMIAGFCASLALRGGSERRVAFLSLASGASASLSLLTKQTVGLGAVACVGVAGTILLAKVDGKRRAFLWCTRFCAGCAIPLAAVALWLWKEHLFLAFIEMLFVKGPAAKASHASDFLRRDLLVAVENPLWVVPALVGLAMGWRAIKRGMLSPNESLPESKERMAWVGAGIATVGFSQILAFTSLPALHDVSKCSVYFVLLGLTFWLPSQLVWLFRTGISRRAAQMVLFGAVAWSIAVMLSLSWPVFEPMALPGLGFLLAAVLDGVKDRYKWFPMLVMAAMVLLQVRGKLDVPFGFGDQNEAAVRLANTASTEPQLRGMRLPPEMVRFLDETVSTVAAHSKPGDTIFTYPEMSLFYSLTGRWFPTWSGSHNIDVVNDDFALEEAERLRRARPAVIIYYRLPEQTLRGEERIWRGGRRGGQRDLIAAIEELVKGYRLAGTYTPTPAGPPINVYVRP